VRLHPGLDDLDLGAEASDFEPELRLVGAELVKYLAQSVHREGQVIDLRGHLPKAAKNAQSYWHCCDDPLGHGVVS
jgi:hypothetical protein